MSFCGGGLVAVAEFCVSVPSRERGHVTCTGKVFLTDVEGVDRGLLLDSSLQTTSHVELPGVFTPVALQLE